MSDLLIILVVLGALIVLGVLVFNWWQEKTFRSRIASDFKPSKRDVLIEDFESSQAQFTQERVKHSAANKVEPQFDRLSEHHATQRKEPIFDDLADEAIYEALTSKDLPAEAMALGIADTPDSNAPVMEDVESYSSVEHPAEMPVAEAISEAFETPLVKPSTYMVEQVSMPDTLHPQIDLIALLYASSPIAQSKVVGLDTQFKEFPERTFAFGLTTENEWIAIQDSRIDQAFTQLAYSLQLADRGGPVNRSTLNRFQHMVETIGLDLSAHVEWQGAGDPLNNAVTLDQFCIEVDKTVGFHLLANNSASFHATKLRGLVEAQGLSLSEDGRFHHLQSLPPHQLEFSIKNYEGNAFTPSMLKSSIMHGVTFQLDIPTVKNSSDVFDNMTSIAKSIAKSLDASIVDDNKKLLGDIQLEKIRQQLKVINATMIAKGIIPGSPHALRLFS